MINGIKRSFSFFTFGMEEIEFQARSCPLCHKKSEYIFGEDREGVGVKYSLCGCGMLFASRYFSEGFLDEFYSTWYSRLYAGTVQNENYSKQKAQSVLQILKLVDFNKYEKICDFGCGNGAVLKRLDSFKERVGFDYDSEIKKMPEGQSLRLMNITSVGEHKNTFDLCLSIQVMEHLLDPHAHLSNLKELINEKGLIYLEVPITHANEVRQAELKLPHCNIFTSQSLGRLADSAGLELLETNDKGGFLFRVRKNVAPQSAISASVGAITLVGKKHVDQIRRLYSIAFRCGKIFKTLFGGNKKSALL